MMPTGVNARMRAGSPYKRNVTLKNRADRKYLINCSVFRRKIN